MVNTETVLVVSVQKAIALKVCDDPATAKHTDYRFLSFLTESIVKLLTTILRLLVRICAHDLLRRTIFVQSI